MGYGGRAAAYLTADEIGHDEEMPLAILTVVAENRIQPSHSGTSLSEVPRDDESYSNASSKKEQ
jgi:hypothetical protein